MGRVLPIRFYARPAVVVARELLGARIVSNVDGLLTVGRIVETEAYTGPDDEASHAAARIGRTARNAAMFGPPGSAYVYRIYGVHWCLNVVTDAVDHPAAVLIRAIEPITGIDVMQERRGRGTIARGLIGRGPGNLARALGIDGTLNFQSLRVAPLRLLRGDVIDDAAIQTGPRIGVTRAVDEPLRFFIRGNPSVSGRRTHSGPPRR